MFVDTHLHFHKRPLLVFRLQNSNAPKIQTDNPLTLPVPPPPPPPTDRHPQELEPPPQNIYVNIQKIAEHSPKIIGPLPPLFGGITFVFSIP